MVLGVSDHTMAMHQWMLFSAALRRRPEYAACLLIPVSDRRRSPKNLRGGVV